MFGQYTTEVWSKIHQTPLIADLHKWQSNSIWVLPSPHNLFCSQKDFTPRCQWAQWPFWSWNAGRHFLIRSLTTELSGQLKQVQISGFTSETFDQTGKVRDKTSVVLQSLLKCRAFLLTMFAASPMGKSERQVFYFNNNFTLFQPNSNKSASVRQLTFEMLILAEQCLASKLELPLMWVHRYDGSYGWVMEGLNQQAAILTQQQ